MRHLLCKQRFGIGRGCGADNYKHGVKREDCTVYINVPEKDV
jgi:hypothetical protein